MEIAPLVDIVLLLLIFFLLTSSVATQSLDLDLPEASTATERSETLTVLITHAGDVLVEGREVNLEMLRSLLQSKIRRGELKTVAIEADAGVPFGIPVQVMDLCRVLGTEGVSIVTRDIGGE